MKLIEFTGLFSGQWRLQQREVPPLDGDCHGKYHERMDDNWGYHHDFGKPPYLRHIYNWGTCSPSSMCIMGWDRVNDMLPWQEMNRPGRPRPRHILNTV